MTSTLEDISTIIRRHLLETYCNVERWPLPSQGGFALRASLRSDHGLKKIATVHVCPQHIEVFTRYNDWGECTTSFVDYHHDDILADLDRILETA